MSEIPSKNPSSSSRKQITIDGNEAAAYVAFAASEVIAIYPITPSSPMGEWTDEWASVGKKNIWGTVPLVQEMQSEAGAAGTVHGALQTGSLTTTFTSSQGLLLMLPNMYKIAGELTPTVFHIAARAVATHSLSIFGDHSDVMASRMTGFAMLCSGSVQEVMDFALIAHAATLKSRLPFLHFFDGFRTSHEIAKIEQLSYGDIRDMIDEELVLTHREHRLTPDQPVIRGTAQNPDVYFQSRETVNPFYNACPDIVQKTMDKFALLTGRQYKLFEYYGVPDAERLVVIMGSGAEACQDTVDKLLKDKQKVGLIKVRLYRPFAIKRFIEIIPKTVKAIAVLDRTKEPGSAGEPLYLDVVNALVETGGENQFKQIPKIIGGRYGLSSKEFTPAMIKGIYDELLKPFAKNHFTVGIHDDLGKTSLDYDEHFTIESGRGVRAIFYGLGADGTVSANKNTIKIIGENTPLYAQGYFVYDSKKAGSVTVSHLRFGPKPIHSTFLVSKANFVACHQYHFIEIYDVLKDIDKEGVFLLNAPYNPEEVCSRLPYSFARTIKDKKLRFFIIDAYRVARQTGLGMRINTIMQTCFFVISGVLPKQEAIVAIKESIRKTYSKKGEDILRMNFEAVDQALAHLHEVKIDKVTSVITLNGQGLADASDFVKNVTSLMMVGKGDELPVSAFPCDGTYPTATSQWEKRNIAQEIPVWDKDICIQCGKCAIVCPHAVIRIKVYDPVHLQGAPQTFQSLDARDREWQGLKYTIQVAAEDCTGCGICVDFCPVKNKSETRLKALNMLPQPPLKEQEKKNWDFFLKIPELKRDLVKKSAVRSSQVLQPLFEFSGACAGCGETPYIKLATQLFGDRMLIANATGCSSIYGGNLPTTPYTKNSEGRGPAWSNSLFEDNAEFGLGFRLSIDKQKELASDLVKKLESHLGTQLVHEILQAAQNDEAAIFQQRQRVAILKQKLDSLTSLPQAKQLLSVADMLVKKSVWIIGGDGWAYDIGFGGLDHVLSLDKDVNVLVLDTEVYSNTGGQMSKSTPRSAVAKFAVGGKPLAKKDLARIAMTYGHVYVATVAMGAKDEHTLRVFLEAESYEGPSLIIAYSHCIAHGINMTTAMQNQKAAVASGYWPLFRYHPNLLKEGKNPFQFDSGPIKASLQEFTDLENRFKMLTRTNPEMAKQLHGLAQKDIQERWQIYNALAATGSYQEGS